MHLDDTTNTVHMEQIERCIESIKAPKLKETNLGENWLPQMLRLKRRIKENTQSFQKVCSERICARHFAKE